MVARLLIGFLALLFAANSQAGMILRGSGGGGGTENLGYESIGENPGTPDSGDVRASPLDNAGHTGTITSIYIYSSNTDAAQDIKLGIYTDSSGPNTLVGSQEFTNVGTWSAEWHQFTGLSIPVTATNSYWLAWSVSIDSVTTMYNDDVTGTRYIDFNTYPTWNDPFTSDGTTTATYSIYAVIEY